jgi:hypothetical protein
MPGPFEILSFKNLRTAMLRLRESAIQSRSKQGAMEILNRRHRHRCRYGHGMENSGERFVVICALP